MLLVFPELDSSRASPFESSLGLGLVELSQAVRKKQITKPAIKVNADFILFSEEVYWIATRVPRSR